MNAIVLNRHGGPEVLELAQLPDPSPGPGEVCVRLRAAGLNRLDLFVRTGSPVLRIKLPHVPGSDGAGVVAGVGAGVRTVKAGDEVVISPGLSCGVCEECLSGRDNLCRQYSVLGNPVPGTYCEAVVLPERNVLPKPAGLSWEEAAAAPLVFLTAWHMLVGRARVRPGETVLVQAAGSGVGSAAIQVARLFHCRVIATARGPEKAARALALGAEACVDTSVHDFREEVLCLTGKAGVDIVIEHVGGEVFEKSVTCLRKGGRLVTCGNTLGPQATLSTAHVFGKHLSVLGSFMGEKPELMQAMKFLGTGQLQAVVDQVFPLREAAAAHRRLESREAFGKVVLRIS